ncbi:hypothetical protein QJQ45_022970, partial [Haematococcus lacustris]
YKKRPAQGDRSKVAGAPGQRPAKQKQLNRCKEAWEEKEHHTLQTFDITQQMPLRSSSGAAILANSEFAPFLQDEFNVSQFTSVVLAGSQTTAQAQSEQLREGVRQLELELAGEVTGKNKELLRSMKRMLDAEVALKDVVLSMDSLQKSVRRIRTEIAGPYEHIKARTTQLHNLHSIVELLRHLVHRIKLTGKLRAQMTAPTSTLDLPKAAKLITDIKAVDAGMDFTNIDVVEEDTAFIQAAAATVQEQAKGDHASEDSPATVLQVLQLLPALMLLVVLLVLVLVLLVMLVVVPAQAALDEGMECMSQAKVGSALQVFFNLDQLSQAVDSLLAQHLQQLDKAARSSLDPRHLGGGPGAAVATAGLLGAAARGPTAAQPGAGASWQEKLWGGLREMADSLVHSASCVWHLQRVAAKKRVRAAGPHACIMRQGRRPGSGQAWQARDNMGQVLMDPLSHVCFLDVLVAPDQDLLCSRFWDEAVRVLAEVFAATAKPSTKAGFVRDALVAGYPKLAQLLETSFQKLLNETSVKGVMPAVTPDQLEQLLASTAPLQAAYLASCLNRMSEAVAQAFPGGPRSLSSLTDVQKCIGVLHEELKAGSSCSMLAALVAGTAGKALALLAEKAEYMAASGPDVRALSLGQPANAAQQRNIGLCSQLQEVLRSLTALLPRLPPSAAPALSNALDTLQVSGLTVAVGPQAVAVELVAPLFRAVVEKVEDGLAKVGGSSRGGWGRGGRRGWLSHVRGLQPPVRGVRGLQPPVAQMHRVDFGPEGLAAAQHGGAEGDVTLTSPHITEVVALITHFRAEFLSRFVPVPSPAVPSCGTVLAERMAARTLVFFVRHASLVRPLGQVGKLQMAKDMAELQMAVGASLYPLEQLHQPYRVLKAFRSLMFSQPDAVLVSPLLRELPPSIVVHHLFGRQVASSLGSAVDQPGPPLDAAARPALHHTRHNLALLPASFQAPHERSGLSPAQYSLWLDSHSTDEVLRGIQTSLDVAGRSASEAAGPEAQEIVQVITSLCATTRL